MSMEKEKDKEAKHPRVVMMITNSNSDDEGERRDAAAATAPSPTTTTTTTRGTTCKDCIMISNFSDSVQKEFYKHHHGVGVMMPGDLLVTGADDGEGGQQKPHNHQMTTTNTDDQDGNKNKEKQEKEGYGRRRISNFSDSVERKFRKHAAATAASSETSTTYSVGGGGSSSSVHTENETTTTSTRPSSQSQPGAYTGAPGRAPTRVNDLRFSLVGRPSSCPGEIEGSDEEEGEQQVENILCEEGRSGEGSLMGDHSAGVQSLTQDDDLPTVEGNNNSRREASLPALAAARTTPTETMPENNNNLGLVEASLVESHQFALDDISEAEPMNQQDLEQKAIKEAKKEQHCKRFACGFVVVACLVVALTLAIGLTNQRGSNVLPDNETQQQPPTGGSPTTRPLPPMKNLELLYDELPEKTKESLYSNDSPQYEAWEWLLHHPNLASMEEWRKKQIFAMGSFFHSFEGTNWPEESPIYGRWMDANTSECSWVLSDPEVEYFAKQSVDILGPAYDHQDYQPCNENGELQSLLVHQLFLPTNAKPLIPPEIELLTSLRIVAIIYSQIGAKLSDLFVPELIQLPSLVHLSFHGIGVSGTIPREIALLTGMRHFLIGANKLTGPIPSEVGKMTSLEYFSAIDMEGVTGRLPSQLGLMTRLTKLEVFRNSLMGIIPSELGLLSHIELLSVDGNLLFGAIPSELGLLTSMSSLNLHSNQLNGPIPTELGMTSAIRLRLWNNALAGSVPSQLGLLRDATGLWLGNNLKLKGHYNNFSGTLPQELWELSHMEDLFLSNLPNLHVRIPNEIMMPNLTSLGLGGSPLLSGTIPEQICFIEELDFDCSNLLCGCHCRCVGGSANETNLGGWN